MDVAAFSIQSPIARKEIDGRVVIGDGAVEIPLFSIGIAAACVVVGEVPGFSTDAPLDEVAAGTYLPVKSTIIYRIAKRIKMV